jgi:catecholate siderophore receptor
MKSSSYKKFKQRAKKARRGTRHWIIAMGAMGAIVAFTMGNSRQMMVAYAQENNGVLEVVRATDEGADVYRFDIPPGVLKTVLESFEKTTGIKVDAENKDVLDVASPGVSGMLTSEQALQKILAGTGVSYTFKGTRSVALELRAEAAVVTIEQSEAKIISSPKYTEPLRDIPQTISVIPKEVIEQQGAATLRDVLNNVPGITITAGEGGAPAGDNLTIRGFSARNDIYVDGVRDLGPQSRDPFNVEQVEVVKGPSSSFTGRGSTGGTINLVSKLPNLKRSFGGDLTVGTSGTLRGTADVNLPINDSIAFRMNAMANNSEYPGREAVQNRRWGLAPAISFGLGTKTRYSLSYFYLRQNNISDYGIPWVPVTNTALAAFRDRPAPVPRETFYGFLDRDKEKLRSDLATFRLERDINDKITLRNQLRYGYSRRDSVATPPRFAANNSTVINRELRSWITNDDIWDNQTDLNANFKTGPIGHAVVFGASLSYEKNTRVLRSAPNASTTLLNPNPNDVYTGVIATSPFVGDVTGNSYAAYLFDTIKFSKQWEFVGGLRWDYFGVDGVSAATTGLTPVRRIDRIFSGRAALIFHPVEYGSIYGSFGTSANPSLEGLSYSTANTAIGPEKTYNYELGTKWGLFRSRLLLTGAIFRVDKTNARTPGIDPSDPPQILDGQQRVDGIELSATGNITRNWQVFAGYTLLDSEVLNSNAFTLVNNIPIFEQGKELINTPRNSFNLWTTYRYGKFFFGGGPRFVDKRFGNNINTRFVDSYWLVDAMASYEVTKNFTLRLNMNNLTDEYYIDRIGGGHIVPGAGRLVTVSTGFRF